MKYTTAVLILLSVTFRGTLCMEESALLKGHSTKKTPLSPRSGYKSINDDVEAQSNNAKVSGCSNEEKTFLGGCIGLCGAIALMITMMATGPLNQNDGNNNPIDQSFSGSYSFSTNNHME